MRHPPVKYVINYYKCEIYLICILKLNEILNVFDTLIFLFLEIKHKIYYDKLEISDRILFSVF